MTEETRNLDDCIDDAKETLVENLEGGENYLRRHGADDTVSDLIHECADGAVPVYTYDLIDVFRSSAELWCEEPDCGFGDGGITDAISRVIYEAIYQALYEYAGELEGDPVMCEADDCGESDDHNEPWDGQTLCTGHCGGEKKCESCQALAEEDAADNARESDVDVDGEPLEKCGSCGADIGFSTTYPWHYDNEDCRAIRDPVEGRITHQECGCPIGRAGHSAHRINTGGERGRSLPYAVGLVGESTIMRQFATEAEASAFIGTLPGHTDGRYYLDGPPVEGTAQ